MAAPTLASPEIAACPVPDEILVERIRSGDRDAFGEVYERYFARIFHFVARRLRNRADTEETVQEVFINVFASIDSFRGEAPFGAWVFGLTRRTVAGRFKKRMPNLVPLGDDEVENGSHGIAREPDPLEAYEYTERLARLEGAVMRRPFRRAARALPTSSHRTPLDPGDRATCYRRARTR